jgi:hydrogenase nickel incorporation protein HypA/HybF
MLSKDTVAEGSTLHFERIKARFRCKDCGEEFEPEPRKFDCPHCENVKVELLAGREFRMESIEVE